MKIRIECSAWVWMLLDIVFLITISQILVTPIKCLYSLKSILNILIITTCQPLLLLGWVWRRDAFFNAAKARGCLRFNGEFSAIGWCLIAPEGFCAATRCVAVAAEQEDVPGLIRARGVTAGDGLHSDEVLIWGIKAVFSSFSVLLVVFGFLCGTFFPLRLFLFFNSTVSASVSILYAAVFFVVVSLLVRTVCFMTPSFSVWLVGLC